MFQVNEMVNYASKGMFQIQEITKKQGANASEQIWYTLYANTDGIETKIQTMADNGLIRRIHDAQDIQMLFHIMPTLDNLWIDDKQAREEMFRRLLQSGELENWAQIARSIYLTRAARQQMKKDISEKDKQYFQRAEDLLFSEIAYALSIPKDQVYEVIKQNVG